VRIAYLPLFKTNYQIFEVSFFMQNIKSLELGFVLFVTNFKIRANFEGFYEFLYYLVSTGLIIFATK